MGVSPSGLSQEFYRRDGTVKASPLPGGKFMIQQIFLSAFRDFKTSSQLTAEQLSAAECIMKCKTGELGYNYYQCSECGHIMRVPCSCGNRNCPNCQAVAKEAWLEERKGELIDAPYFHIVGTLPHELNPLLAANKKILYELLHRSMGKSLVELSNDTQYLGATPGIIQIIHTWDQQLNYHVHVHCVISGGGLDEKGKLIVLKPGTSFFIPVKVIAAMYRGKFMAGLRDLYNAGKLTLPKSLASLAAPDDWKAYISNLYKIDWNVYIKQTFNGNGNAIEYLARYANRIAISNNRIVSVSGDTVTFSYIDRKDNCRKKEMTVTHQEFIRLFLQHVIPKGFQKIRYYGFLSNSTRKKNLETIFAQQGGRKYEPRFDKSTPLDAIVTSVWGGHVNECPCCGNDTMEFISSTREIRMMEKASGYKSPPTIKWQPRGQPA